MNIGDWITLAAVIVALGIGVASILHTQSLQKKERRERLLNEIIEWANDVAVCEFTVNIQEPLPIFSRLYEKDMLQLSKADEEKILEGIKKDVDRFWLHHIMNLHRNYQALGAKGEYILILSNAKYFESIINNVRTVNAQISDHEEGLWEYMKNMDDKDRRDKLENKAKELNTSAVKLIRKATKINTRDIS